MSQEQVTAPVFQGGGDAGARMSALDWSKTPLGDVATWPQTLVSVLGICVRSRFPIAIYWGEPLTLLYNDAWSPILGNKHPWALGQGAREVWPEIWSDIGPLFEQVMGTGDATYTEDGLLPMRRHGYTEECYFNFTFTPVRGADGRVEGVFNAVIETTFRVLSERRARVLRELGDRSGRARSNEDVAAAVTEALRTAANDVPFALLYLAEESPDGRASRLACVGLDAQGPAAPVEVAMNGVGAAWPFAAAVSSDDVTLVADLAERFGIAFPGGAWPEPTDAAFVVRLRAASKTLGFLVLGKNPRRAFDDEYRQFVERAAALVATALANVSAYEEERRRAEALAELDRAKTAFFANVSHEFRTPLTLMVGPTEDALASPARALVGEDLETVHRNELRLLKLVNTLLEFSRIEAGRVEASYDPVDLAALTQDLASMFRSTIERAGLGFEVSCEALPEPVYVDRQMWEKIVLNLLSNAFKFTFEGSIAVALRARGDRVELVVRDTGVGIPAQELPRLFERFHRVEGTRGRTHEGTGIGLALVHDLVKLHEGSIAVTSDVGAGTTFTVALPRGSAHLPRERLGAAAATPAAPSALASYVVEARRWLTADDLRDDGRAGAPTAVDADAPHVLVADDNADMREYVTRILRERFHVEAVANGAAALAAARARPPDLVLTDVMMPELDGFGLLRALRADGRTAQAPVIMLSARAGEESRVEALQSGADDYLVKPFSARELVARITTHLNLARLRGAAQEASRAKDEFLAMLGHELRNPLSPILTALQLLRMRGQATREHAVIERQVGHLIRLVDDLLDVSRITRGKVELRTERLELSQPVLRGLEMAAPLLEQRRQRVELHVPTEGLPLLGDPDRLAQVVSNLVTNASKYSEPQTTITVIGERDADRVTLRIVDQGIGLVPEMLDRVFDVFVQQPQAIDRSKGGLGLGLAIVRSLVVLHGGKVFARSAGLGLGSEFVVELPVADASPDVGVASVPDETARPAPAATSRRRILVVDDNQDVAESIKDVLTELGHEVAIANDGPSALVLARTFKPQVCILDVGLPVMDGYELVQRLRASGDLPSGARLVALTGYGSDADRRRSAEAGFDAHLVKPASLDVLTKIVLP